MKLIPKKTFLLRQEGKGKNLKTIVAHKGVEIDVTDAEAVKFAGYWDIDSKRGEEDKKKIEKAAKADPSLKRTV